MELPRRSQRVFFRLYALFLACHMWVRHDLILLAATSARFPAIVDIAVRTDCLARHQQRPRPPTLQDSAQKWRPGSSPSSMGGVLLLRGLGRVPLRVSSFLSLLGPFRFPPGDTLLNCSLVTALRRDRLLRIRFFGCQNFCQMRTGFVNPRRQCKDNDLSHQVPLSTRTGLGSDATLMLFPSLQSSWQGWWPTTFQDGYSLRLLSSGT